MADAFRAVEAAARDAGAAIADSEIIGLVPRAALADLAVVAPAIAARHGEQVLEDRLAARGLPAVGPATAHP
jgi:glutamate formiminotransferase